MKIGFKIFFGLAAFFAVVIFSAGSAFCFDENAHFPTILTNKKENPNSGGDLPLKKSRIFFSSGNRKVSGILVNPLDAKKEKKYPGILLIQPSDESPEQWLDKMSAIASNGYVVMAAEYKGLGDVEESFRNIKLVDFVDSSKVGVMSIYDGVEQGMLLASKKPGGLSCLVCISGRPPYEINGHPPAEELSCPVFLIHGAIDSQVPASVSQYFYYNYRDLDKPAKIFIMRNSRHLYSDAEWSQVHYEFVQYFDVHLKGMPDPDSDEKQDKK